MDETDISKLVASDYAACQMAESAYHDGTFTIGSILDHMAGNWDREQRSHVNSAKAIRGKPHVWVDFPREACKAELYRRFEYLNPESPNNEARRFFRKNIENVMRVHQTGDHAAYKLSGGRG